MRITITIPWHHDSIRLLLDEGVTSTQSAQNTKFYYIKSKIRLWFLDTSQNKMEQVSIFS